ncbi:MAG: M48 family metallopeptidase [Muribaculaceae bacterium]|nr:M48 family metallopeptidase [Muribaculaceae bacterium]
MRILTKSSSKFIVSFIFITFLFTSLPSFAKIQLDKIISGATKAYSAFTLSDEDIKNYVHEYVVYSDANNKIAPDNSEYTLRLIKLTDGLKEVDGQPLNFKVYITNEVNAFACADGSVRVYSSLMDLMNDDEVLGVIGHEIGHVAHKDTKNAMKQALLNSALFDSLGSTGETMANLTDSQLGAIGQSLLSSKYSRKQETNADDYGYDFLKKNGKNPWSMAMAFSKLQELESSGSNNALVNMFSSHPQTKDRINNIIKKCKKDKIAKPEGCDLK